ncbi:hypothetical protein [Sorangium sp. So ce1335]|uniref:hypothetical protein n=1 Tax=Sorangium sp. So ce1335 TaxID=3133335 RepID=UPI003F6365C6
MAIGLSAAACSVDAIEDYVNDNFGTGGGDAASSSQSSTTTGTGSGATTAGTGGAGASGSGSGGSGAGTEAGSGGGGAGTEAGSGGSGAGTEAGSGGSGAGTEAGSGGAGGTGGGGAGGGTGGAGGGGAPPADPACGPDTATFAQVQPILEASCSNQYCHGSPTAPSAGLDLRAAAAVGALVNQDARSCSSEHALVVPFMPSSSYLINKLKGVDLCGSNEIKMPPGGSLSEADMKTITDWICAGAPAE